MPAPSPARQALDAIQACLAELPDMPVRVDEMTPREFAIYQIAAAAIGTLQNVERSLVLSEGLAEEVPKKTTNPHRIECIRSLRTSDKQPARTMGVSPHWLWYGRKYLYRNKTDHLEQHFLPDIAFDLLDGYYKGDEYSRTYKTREDAMAAFWRAVARLEHEL